MWMANSYTHTEHGRHAKMRTKNYSVIWSIKPYAWTKHEEVPFLLFALLLLKYKTLMIIMQNERCLSIFKAIWSMP